MRGWFCSAAELDDEQKEFIKLPSVGRYALVGPPGSGKTNLLLLRARFLAGTGEKNVLVLTYTRNLADFIRMGIASDDLISPNQVRTYHSWASDHIFQNLGKRALSEGSDFDEEVRERIVAMVEEANQALSTPKIYSAIFVDEAQDLTVGELKALLCLSDNVCICGDSRQGIYHRDGLDIGNVLGLEQHKLRRHFRIGPKIARVADRLMPPEEGSQGLEETSNYNPKQQGESSAELIACASRDEQFSLMLENIRIQLDAFAGDTIGIFCPKKDMLIELRERFDESDIGELICVHGVDSESSFSDEDHPVHVLTVHGSKGAEFRAVHMYACEELKSFPMNRRKLGYTAITRAKTSLIAYLTGETNKPLENAFSKPKYFDLEDLFPGGV